MALRRKAQSRFLQPVHPPASIFEKCAADHNSAHTPDATVAPLAGGLIARVGGLIPVTGLVERLHLVCPSS
jgi:hypothetical protein